MLGGRQASTVILLRMWLIETRQAQDQLALQDGLHVREELNADITMIHVAHEMVEFLKEKPCLVSMEDIVRCSTTCQIVERRL